MKFLIRQRLAVYKKFKLDIWGVIRNSLLMEMQWRKFNYKRIIKRYKMYNEAKDHNNKKIENKKYDISFGKRLNKRYLYKLKVFWNLVNIVFKIKPSKNLNKICLFFFNKKKKKFNLNWWKKKYFIYEVRDTYLKKKRKKYKKEFLDIRLAKNFYIIYTYKHLQKIVKKSKRKDGLFESNLIYFMECKLPSFIYRSSFLPNMFESFFYVKNNNVAVNKIFRSFIFFSVKVMDIVTFRIWEKSYIYWEFYKRLKKKAFLFFFPKYMYISFIFFFIICISMPMNKDMINPITMDFYKASNFSI